ncbi:MAG TPA: PAS domain S-box protein, partial [Candidatus Paceibacterota bacterium]|nr:PAS domain S-box protein [Candidatus Paceibacterota bacterium]
MPSWLWMPLYCTSHLTINLKNERKEGYMKKASLEMLRMLVDESPLAIIAIDSKGKVLHWNLTAETILGFPADEVIGKTLSHLIVPADKLEEDEAIYENARRGDVIRTHVTLRKTKDGSLLCVNLSTRAKFDKRGQIECFVINIMDVTQLKVMQDPDLKLLEEQLRERQRDLEQKIEEVYRFSYAIAHDLRGSIRHIKGFAEIIDEEKEALPAQVIGYPGRIIKSAGEMNQLLDDIYELSRLTHGKLRVRKVNLTGI